MPPAFNLSQDQTLLFDLLVLLSLELKFPSFLALSVCVLFALASRLSPRGLCALSSNAHAYRLCVFKDPRYKSFSKLLPLCTSAAISRAAYFSNFFYLRANHGVYRLSSPRSAVASQLPAGFHQFPQLRWHSCCHTPASSDLGRSAAEPAIL